MFNSFDIKPKSFDKVSLCSLCNFGFFIVASFWRFCLFVLLSFIADVFREISLQSSLKVPDKSDYLKRCLTFFGHSSICVRDEKKLITSKFDLDTVCGESSNHFNRIAIFIEIYLGAVIVKFNRLIFIFKRIQI